MSGEERRNLILQTIIDSTSPVSGTALANKFQVSRQVIVQDIALLRANGKNVVSTNRGYILEESKNPTRVFKVIHSDEQTEDELNLFVDHGAKVVDVFLYHKVYGVVSAEMNIKSRMDVKKYMESLKTGSSSLLKNVTSGYHYHTISADSEEILDEIQETLWEKGYLAKLKEHEPVEFG